MLVHQISLVAQWFNQHSFHGIFKNEILSIYFIWEVHALIVWMVAAGSSWDSQHIFKNSWSWAVHITGLASKRASIPIGCTLCSYGTVTCTFFQWRWRPTILSITLSITFRLILIFPPCSQFPYIVSNMESQEDHSVLSYRRFCFPHPISSTQCLLALSHSCSPRRPRLSNKQNENAVSC